MFIVTEYAALKYSNCNIPGHIYKILVKTLKVTGIFKFLLTENLCILKLIIWTRSRLHNT